jgi:hypothetical protein
MGHSFKILISAAFSHHSRGIVRSIKLSPKYSDSYLIGTDICNSYFGLYEGLYNKVYKIPRYSEPGYKNRFLKIIEQENADIVMITNELEVQFWARSSKKLVNALLPPVNFTEICISKKRLHAAFENTEYVPWFKIVDLKNETVDLDFAYPVWIRDIQEGSSGGRGAFLIKSKNHFHAWISLYEPGSAIMVSEYLPGRNLACLLVIENNVLRSAGTYERMEYLLKHASPSGITGQISKGRLICEPALTKFSFEAVIELLDITRETFSGFVTVDVKEGRDGNPYVTEINLRPVSPVFAFAQAGFNLVEDYIDLILNKPSTLPCIEHSYPDDNLLLREIDGLPLWIENHKDINTFEL